MNNNRKIRIDKLIFEQEMVPSRSRARALIMAGKVLVDDVPVTKAGTKVDPQASIRLKTPDHPWVSRGGLKIEKGIEVFQTPIKDMVALDVGASTGGFTDYLLQHGADFVHALDVGYGQLHWKLRQDKRVKVWERTNIRYCKKEDFSPQPHLATVDVSFISLKLVIPVLFQILDSGDQIVALVKPQFEVGKGQVGKGGIVRDMKLRLKTVEEVIDFLKEKGARLKGPVESPIKGPGGNVEFLIEITVP
ncbi:MAG: TlyA family RNA methyltransferase [Myxococcota bacterium]